MALPPKDLWSLELYWSRIDPIDLTQAIRDQIESEDLDYRTRLLIRDSMVALRSCWAPWQMEEWLASCPVRDRIEAICREEFERPGFPSLPRRLGVRTRPEDVLGFLRELGEAVRQTTRLVLGGAAALIVTEHLGRHTEGLDVVGEIPRAVRLLGDVLGDLKCRYCLHVSRMLPEYLPTGWECRVHRGDESGR